MKDSSGAADEQMLLHSSDPKFAADWSPDGRFVLFTNRNSQTGFDVLALPLEGDRKPLPVAQTGFGELNGRFSPDGRWVAYQSDESGVPQVYVQAFPAAGGKFQVSASGGFEPQWLGDGKEIYYLGPDGQMMAVDVKAAARSATAPFESSRPRELFRAARPVRSLPYISTYAVSADGQRFLVNSGLETVSLPSINVVTNWVPGN